MKRNSPLLDEITNKLLTSPDKIHGDTAFATGSYAKHDNMHGYGTQAHYIYYSSDDLTTGLVINPDRTIAKGDEGNELTFKVIELPVGGVAIVEYAGGVLTLSVLVTTTMASIKTLIDALTGFTTDTFGVQGTTTGSFPEELKFTGGSKDRKMLFRIIANNDIWFHQGTTAPTNDDNSRHMGTISYNSGILTPGNEMYFKRATGSTTRGSLELWYLENDR